VSGQPEGTFDVDEAAEAAARVFHHEPGTPFLDPKEPANQTAAAAAVRRLGQLFSELPASIRQALRGAETNAGHLSDDRLQGLAELIQNADDVGATRVTFAVESGPTGNAILCSHNGSSLRLMDVMGLATPWLSLKSSDSKSLGRFGIGLMTLRSLSDSLEVYCGHFHLSLASQRLTPLDSRGFPEGTGGQGTTVFRIPIRGDAVTEDEIASWLDSWGDAGLIFLGSVRSVEILDRDGDPVSASHLTRGELAVNSDAGDPIGCREVMAADGRRWLVYSQDAPTPPHLRRSLKAQAVTTPVSIAFPVGHFDPGHIHVGLPVRPVGLPFRVSAQFDPLANRRDVADNDWNIGLISAISQLWLNASRDVFIQSPQIGWATVPLVGELDRDVRTHGRLREAIDGQLMTDARTTLAKTLSFRIENYGQLGLDDLAFEHPDLTSILQPEDTAKLAGRRAALPLDARDSDELWRIVMKDLAEAGASTPEEVDVAAAVSLLDEGSRPAALVSDLTSVAISHGLGLELSGVPCLVLDDGSRASPDAVTGTVSLVDENAAPLWHTLRMGVRLHPDYTSRHGWARVQTWLVEHEHFLVGATTGQALARLARSGRIGEELPHPLSDTQAEELRAALESANDADRASWGPGIGKAVRLDATEYGPRGQRIAVKARPCDAYIIEREAGTWQAAAGKTPGLIWLHRRYGTALRAESGRTGIGAQRLFRLLGAETAPRLIAHPKARQRFAYGKPGVPRDIPDLANRREVLQQKRATFTIDDFISPDLESVLRSIAAEKTAVERRRRANAVLLTLTKAWDRIGPHAEASAVEPHHVWQNRGIVPACWLFSAASIAWLSDGNRVAARPSSLKLRSPGNVALHGSAPANFLHPEHDNPAWHPVLEKLEVHGDPRASELIRALEDVRAIYEGDPAAAEEAAVPLYQALAQQIPSSMIADRFVGDLSKSDAMAAFGRDRGLIATKNGWRRPSSVLSGPPVFGNYRAFVPAVSGTERLWRLVGVRPPSFDDARDVIREVAKNEVLNQDRLLVMLESLRLMSKNAEGGSGLRRKNLSRTPVWTSKGWVTQRPVLAVLNHQLAEALEETAAVWKPGGDVRQFDNLIEPLALTRLAESDVRVVAGDNAFEDESVAEVFPRAVRNLQADLSMNDAEAEQSLTVPWDELVGFEVRVLPGLSLTVNQPQLKDRSPLRVGAWIDPSARTLYLADATEGGRAASGGNALASLFGIEARRVAQAWMVAWSDGVEGHRAETLTLASRRAADEAARREASRENRLDNLRRQAKAKRGSARVPALKFPTPDGSRPELNDRHPLPARILVDPSTLTILNPGGTIQGSGQTAADPSERSEKTAGLKSPDRGNPKQKSVGRGSVNYTPEERESVGMALVRHVLGGEEAGVVDIRNQRNVGADAIDDLQRYFELKVYQGAIPNVVRLTDSEVQRALNTEDFFLVLVGNVEQGTDQPEMRILTDPLTQLSVEPTGTIHLSGVYNAQALVYSFGTPQRSAGEEQAPDAEAVD
jgi:hypothetical protein